MGDVKFSKKLINFLICSLLIIRTKMEAKDMFRKQLIVTMMSLSTAKRHSSLIFEEKNEEVDVRVSSQYVENIVRYKHGRMVMIIYLL